MTVIQFNPSMKDDTPMLPLASMTPNLKSLLRITYPTTLLSIPLTIQNKSPRNRFLTNLPKNQSNNQFLRLRALISPTNPQNNPSKTLQRLSNQSPGMSQVIKHPKTQLQKSKVRPIKKSHIKRSLLKGRQRQIKIMMSRRREKQLRIRLKARLMWKKANHRFKDRIMIQVRERRRKRILKVMILHRFLLQMRGMTLISSLSQLCKKMRRLRSQCLSHHLILRSDRRNHTLSRQASSRQVISNQVTSKHQVSLKALILKRNEVKNQSQANRQNLHESHQVKVIKRKVRNLQRSHQAQMKRCKNQA